MRTSTLFSQKNSRVFEIYGVSARTRGVKGLIFRDFVRTSFMDGPLILVLLMCETWVAINYLANC